ncbi:MAG: hypothetical protein QM726_14300 [Chitinophagaceae bacterium]
MKKYLTGIMVALVMLFGVLGITNPAFRQPYKFLDNVEGKVESNYFIFSIYKQYSGYSLSKDGKYKIYKRYLGIALSFYEISPVYEERYQGN